MDLKNFIKLIVIGAKVIKLGHNPIRKKKWMVLPSILSFLFLVPVLAETNAQAFKIRGTLPWHNFLCGPSAWNEQDYEQYLDKMQKLGLNFIGFHCYSGGSYWHHTYVEPLIKITYRNVTPEASFDTSVLPRWGCRSMRISDFVFGTDKLYTQPDGIDVFGPYNTILAKDNADRYDRTQALMRKVLKMAHERDIQFAMGFEFGSYPLEITQILPQSEKSMIPDPTRPSSIEILQNTIDNILTAYPDLDYLWLWLREHHSTIKGARLSDVFSQFYKENKHYFNAKDQNIVFTGVWSLDYIREAFEYVENKAPGLKVIIGGWGGEEQLVPLLSGLDKTLPREIIFSCLNPQQGYESHPHVMAKIAKNRMVISIPWLEGDAKLWHYQPRVHLMKEHVKKSYKDGLDGIVGIHWRTEEIKTNLKTFSMFAENPLLNLSVEDIYLQEFKTLFGNHAAEKIAPLMTEIDLYEVADSAHYVPHSPIYWAYEPNSWCRMDSIQTLQYNSLIQAINELLNGSLKPTHRENLQWLMANFQVTVYLDRISRKMKKAYNLKNQWLTGEIKMSNLDALKLARAELHQAPIEPLFRTYAGRVRSQGERGVLCSLNRKLYLQYKELDEFLQNLLTRMQN